MPSPRRQINGACGPDVPMLELGDGNEMQIGMFCGWGNDREGGGDQSSLMLFQTCSVSEIGIRGREAHICSKFPIVPYRIWPNCRPTLTDPIGT